MSPRHVEIAPARVIRSEDGHRCTLHIDHEYARHHLHDHNFDVFITLRCDKVIDEHGRAGRRRPAGRACAKMRIAIISSSTRPATAYRAACSRVGFESGGKDNRRRSERRPP